MDVGRCERAELHPPAVIDVRHRCRQIRGRQLWQISIAIADCARDPFQNINDSKYAERAVLGEVFRLLVRAADER
jgi:hypothetical protein